MFGPAIAMLGASALGSLFNRNKGTTVNQGPLETPEQQKARQALLDFARGNPSYQGPLGNYSMSPAESAGQSKLMGLIQGGRPSIFDAGTGEINKLLTTDSYDPFNSNGQYTGMAKNIDQATADATAGVKRDASIMGNLYGTDTIQNLGRTETQGALNKQNLLAGLYDTYVQRKLSAAPMAIGAAQAQQGMDLGAIGAAETYGALPRELANQQDKDAYGEFVRSQGATTSALGAVSGGPPQWGTSSFTLPGNGGPWGNFLNTLAAGGAYGLGMGMASGTGSDWSSSSSMGMPGMYGMNFSGPMDLSWAGGY